jgi:hypothetical protein
MGSGVEVRQFRTVLYDYADITDVRVDRGNKDRTITLALRHGRIRNLPAPTRGLRPPSDTGWTTHSSPSDAAVV